VWTEALSTSNICSRFAATSLVLYEPDQVLLQLYIQIKISTPSTIFYSNQLASWIPETPHNIKELKLQTWAFKHLLKHHSQSSSSPANQTLNQLVKGCQIAMHNTILLAQENKELQTINQHQKKRNAPRSYIATGDILTGAEELQHAQEANQRQEEVVAQADLQPQKQAPPTCSTCNIVGHTRVQCSRC